MTDVAAIVLAAGLSSRMGTQNKLLLSIGESQMLHHVVQCMAQVSDHPVTVVTGHEQAAIASSLSAQPVKLVHNPSYKDGQMSSVDIGLRHAPMAQTTILALGDQPYLKVDPLKEMLLYHEGLAKGRITIPFVQGERGNPILIPKHMRQIMLSDPMNLGCRNLTRARPDLVHRFETDHVGFVTDIDTAEDYIRLCGKQIEEMHS